MRQFFIRLAAESRANLTSGQVRNVQARWRRSLTWYVRSPGVADWIESRIKSGELKAGARLPTERDLARDFGVAYDTVRRAALLLRERGLIITVHGRGAYVA